MRRDFHAVSCTTSKRIVRLVVKGTNSLQRRTFAVFVAERENVAFVSGVGQVAVRVFYSGKVFAFCLDH